jgi:hypothetical protein
MELFLSVRTVEWHLRKIFIKLGIGSRRELRTVLNSLGPDRPAVLCPDAEAAVGDLHLVHVERPGRRAADRGAGGHVNSEPWHWHIIVVPVSKPPDSGHEAPGQVQRSSNAYSWPPARATEIRSLRSLR